MGIRLSSVHNKVAIFDSVSGFAFGPVFDTDQEADDFVAFAERRLDKDLRTATVREIEEVFGTFLMANERAYG